MAQKVKFDMTELIGMLYHDYMMAMEAFNVKLPGTTKQNYMWLYKSNACTILHMLKNLDKKSFEKAMSENDLLMCPDDIEF